MDILESLRILFPISGVETYVFTPVLVTFCLSFVTSVAGMSGAFLLLPINMSFFGYTAVSVTATNFFYNAVGIPGGVARYIKEGRMVWPLAGAMTAGTLPGVGIGYWLRMRFLPDPRPFKLFVGCVLLFMAWRLIAAFWAKKAPPPGKEKIRDLRWSLLRISYQYAGQMVSVSVPLLAGVSFLVGIVGGIYGIGGGALYIPFCVGFLGIPIHTLAGAALFGTFATSVVGCGIYALVPVAGQVAPPDWLLGFLYGLGGLAGMYTGARFQKHLPDHLIKGFLGVVLVVVAGRYIVQYFW